MVIPKEEFFEWLLGADNPFVQAMKRDTDKWTHDLPIPKGWEAGETVKLRMPGKKK